VETADAILLSNHGVVAYGKEPYDAYYKMEKVEHAAHITFVARMLGGENILSARDVEKLRAISQQSYGLNPSGKPACEPGDTPAADIPSFPDKEIRDAVRDMIHRKGG
jgi:L-fuculose-phosphate aldolase